MQTSVRSHLMVNLSWYRQSLLRSQFAQLNIRWDHFVWVFVHIFLQTCCCFTCVSLSRSVFVLCFSGHKAILRVTENEVKNRLSPPDIAQKCWAKKIHSLTSIEIRNKAKPLISLFILLNTFCSRCNFHTERWFTDWPMCRMFGIAFRQSQRKQIGFTDKVNESTKVGSVAWRLNRNS